MVFINDPFIIVVSCVNRTPRGSLLVIFDGCWRLIFFSLCSIELVMNKRFSIVYPDLWYRTCVVDGFDLQAQVQQRQRASTMGTADVYFSCHWYAVSVAIGRSSKRKLSRRWRRRRLFFFDRTRATPTVIQHYNVSVSSFVFLHGSLRPSEILWRVFLIAFAQASSFMVFKQRNHCPSSDVKYKTHAALVQQMYNTYPTDFEKKFVSSMYTVRKFHDCRR